MVVVLASVIVVPDDRPLAIFIASVIDPVLQRDLIVGELVDALLVGGVMTKSKLRSGRGGKDEVDRAIAFLVRQGLAAVNMRGQKHNGYVITDAGRDFADGRVGAARQPCPVAPLDISALLPVSAQR